MALTEIADVAIPELAPLQRKLLTAGALGMIVSLVGLLVNPTGFLQSFFDLTVDKMFDPEDEVTGS